jgi:hypothetical protein
MVFLWDIDGVLIQHERYFSQHIEAEHEGAIAILNEYYSSGINQDCDRGLLDPRIEIQPYIERIGWKGDGQSYLQAQYDFEMQFIDRELLARIEASRSRAKHFIATNQNPLRKAVLMRELRIGAIFDGAFFSCDFGRIKPELGYFEHVVSRLEAERMLVKGERLVFFDDVAANVEGARLAGIEAHQVRSREEARELFARIYSELIPS